ncbi:transglutaminase-like domain-containing protein, partial [Candidatus Woesearchaeota archaeon]|nr:transglutaminase-like domain-containing protein [Candidatus Woesearchaeota archaeon]
MKKLIFIILLFAIPSALAQNLTYADSLLLENTLSSSYAVVPEAENYTLGYIQINLSFYPKETVSQKIIELSTYPDSKTSANNIIFRINSPETEGSYSVKSRLRTNKYFVGINKKILFPVENTSSDLKMYIEPSEYIDSDNPEIIRLASELAEGEDNLFVVVSKLADWTKQNVEYNISTLTEDVSQKSSWVLENREGVCDEITNLFIGLNRALGIPARFVSGLSYTETLKNRWGAHGWAEVYFPGYGWVPFDVTYGEYGYIDPAHILYKTTLDSKDITTSYGWYGSNVHVDFDDLDFSVKVLEEKKYDQGHYIDAKAVYEKVNFGSYNVVVAAVTNPNNYYIAPNLRLEKVRHLENIGSNERVVILPP